MRKATTAIKPIYCCGIINVKLVSSGSRDIHVVCRAAFMCIKQTTTTRRLLP